MSNIARRIEKLEKIMSVGKKRKIIEFIITLHKIDGLEGEQEQKDKLGPHKNWLTYQEQLATAREDQADNAIKFITISLFVKKEVQAREFQNTALEEEKRAERIQEYRTVLKDKIYPNLARV